MEAKKKEEEETRPPARIYTCTIWFGRTHPPSGRPCKTPYYESATDTKRGEKSKKKGKTK
jgi:hypothetical protein